MKRADKSAKTTRDLDVLISKLSGNEILNLHALSCVRGGGVEGEDNGSVPIIIIPKPV